MLFKIFSSNITPSSLNPLILIYYFCHENLFKNFCRNYSDYLIYPKDNWRYQWEVTPTESRNDKVSVTPCDRTRQKYR